LTVNPSTGEVRMGATNSTGTYFTTLYSNGSERARIDVSGNMGLGGTPVSNGAGSTVLNVNATTGGATVHLTNNTTGTTNSDGSLFVQSGSDLLFINRESGNLKLRTADTDRLIIDSSGDLLVLGGTIRTKSADNSQQYGAIYGNTSEFSINSGVNNLGLYSAGTLALTIDSSQRVGIGTALPSTKLHVSGASSASALRLDETTSSANSYLGYIDTSGNFGIDVNGGGYLRFAVGGAERARIDSNGALLIGKTAISITDLGSEITPEGVFRAVGSSTSTNLAINAGGRLNLANNSATDGNFSCIGGYNSNGLVTSQIDFINVSHSSRTGDIAFLTHTGASMPERARITSAGDLLVNTSSAIASASNTANNFTFSPSSGYAWLAVSDSGGVYTQRQNDGNFFTFYKTTSNVGSISVSGSTTAYNTTSDYRLKENVINITDGITRIKSLKPSRFNFLAEADRTVDGFVAHEVSDVVPEAISGAKDAVDDEGNPEYQGIDQSKLVPLLTAALQEAITKIETLETKVAALEAA